MVFNLVILSMSRRKLKLKHCSKNEKKKTLFLKQPKNESKTNTLK